jgi:acetoin utilization deacetylase AcuC-like enzyme
LPRGGQGNLMFLLEGGYDLDGLAGGVRQTVAALNASLDAEPGGAPSSVGAPWQQDLGAIWSAQRDRWDVSL